MFINPVYSKPLVINNVAHTTQHDLLAKSGSPAVCMYRSEKWREAVDCARRSLNEDLTGRQSLPEELTREAYRRRLLRIFGPKCLACQQQPQQQQQQQMGTVL